MLFPKESKGKFFTVELVLDNMTTKHDKFLRVKITFKTSYLSNYQERFFMFRLLYSNSI